MVRALIGDGRASELVEALSFVQLSPLPSVGELERVAIDGFARGELVVVEALGRSFRIGPREDDAPPPPAKPKPDDKPQTSTYFEVELVDEIGEPIAGVPLTLKV